MRNTGASQPGRRRQMPRTWYLFRGCPRPEECNRRKTNGKPKKLKFGGSSKQEAVDALVDHLANSDLHNLAKSDAYEVARQLKVEEIVEDEDEVHQALPGHGRKRSNKEESSSDEVPVHARKRSNKEAHQARPVHARKRSNKEESSSDEVPVHARKRSNKEESSGDESTDEESANPERTRRIRLVAKRTGGSDHDVPPSERDVIVKESYWITVRDLMSEADEKVLRAKRAAEEAARACGELSTKLHALDEEMEAATR